MLKVTVKTIENENHNFVIGDDVTVAQFKEHIAPTVNIPADTQRIIYCGRVLQDTSKLNEYDINGKVVHLVRRPPPSATQPSRPDNPEQQQQQQQQQRRRFRGMEYLGSMRIPANGADASGGVHPTHSLAASRLNVAKRMLRKAELVLNGLENPTARSTEVPSQEENQEEVTPVFEARVFVPNNANNYPIDDALLSAVENSILRTSTPVTDLDGTGSTNQDPENSNTIGIEITDSILPEGVTPINASTENLASMNVETEATAETSATNIPNGNTDSVPGGSTATNTPEGNETETNNRRSANENTSTTRQYADLMVHLDRVQDRLRPFLHEYYTFMRNDPVVPAESARETQVMINKVSEILHFLGHAYHSLSDIIIRVRTPPPRPLLCRPILIQHSVVQTGIPIQVEAQINFPPPPNSGNNTNNTNTTTTTTTTPPTPTITNLLNSNSMPRDFNIAQLMGFPMGPRVHVETFTLPRPPQTLFSSSDGLFSTVPITVTNNAEDLHRANNQNPSSAQPPRTDQGRTNSSTNRPSDLNNSGQYPNMELFIEVNPEGITVDSIEATLLTPNQDGEMTQGNLNSAPPELMQSIMQMAGQLIGRSALSVVNAARAANMGATAPPTSTTPTTTPTTNGTNTDTSTTETTTTGTAGAARTTPFQNSQARGTTQTFPTTATYTRSTSRPHVHLAQHSMQGFDPFLPCNSHHITRRRRHHSHQSPSQRPQAAQQDQQAGADATATPSTTASTPTTTPTTAAPPTDPTPRNMDDLMFADSLDHSYARFTEGNNAREDIAAPLYNIFQTVVNSLGGTSGQPQANASTPMPVPILSWMTTLQNMNLSEHPAPTIATLLQDFTDSHYTEGENMFTDFIMLLSRNITLRDIIAFNTGSIDPIVRIRPQLRNFVNTRILEGDSDSNSESVERGVDRLIQDVEPFIENLEILPTRDNIDIVASMRALLRGRLPNLISLVLSNSPHAFRILIDQSRTTIRQAFALILYASHNGSPGVETAFSELTTRGMQGIPNDLQQWTMFTSTSHIRQFLSSIDVPESILRPYIIKKHTNNTDVPRQSATPVVETNTADVELMQVDEPENTSSGSTNISNVANIVEETDEVPVVIGSESWHSEVPRNWVPIISRDTQKQRKQASQGPFSDAYLSGMPSKRRKVVNNEKLQGSLPQIISESVRRAVRASGTATTVPIEVVAQAAGENLNIQAAYRDLLRSTVQSSLRNNQDFTPERFPNTNDYFNPDSK